MENLCSNRKRAIEELERGRELANQLRRVIQRSHGGGGDEDDKSKTTPFAQDLADKVERSFSNTLALLIRRGGGGDESDDVVSQMLTDYSSCLVPAKSDDSEDTCKSSPAVKERRGSYKRRRTSQTWERDSEAPTDDDGHAWRKYGQKTIMNAKFPRNYYRCTHKYDQGCQATKQVQRIQEEPVLYRTTYYGHHTCNKNLLNPEIILDTGSANSDSSILLSFDNNTLSSKQDLPFFSSSSLSLSPSPSLSPSSSLPLASKESKQEIPSSSSEDYLLTHELITTLSSSLDSNHKDVIPDVLYDESVEFNDFFEPFDV